MLDPDVDALLASITIRNDKAHLDAAIAANTTKNLRERYEATQDPRGYLDLLAAWSRFSKGGFEPAASQLYAIVQTLPESAASLAEQRAQAEAMVSGGKHNGASGLENKGATGARGPGDDVEY